MRIAALDFRHYVARMNLANLRRRSPRDPQRHRHRLKSAGIGHLQQLIDAVPQGCSQLFSCVFCHPSRQRQLLCARREFYLAVLAAPRRPHHFPSITRGRRRVNDDGGDRAAPGRFLIFIGPAAVVRQRPPGEELRIVRRRLIGEKDHHFPTHIDTGVIVPLIFRRHNAMTNEYRFRIERRIGLLLIRDTHKIVEPPERSVARSEGARRLRLDTHQCQILKISTRIARRLRAH